MCLSHYSIDGAVSHLHQSDEAPILWTGIQRGGSVFIMAKDANQDIKQSKTEQQLARAQRQELKDELSEQFANRPRLPQNRRRVITFGVLGVLGVLVLTFGILVLLPAPPQQARAGVAVGAQAQDFTLPILGGPGKGSVHLRALRGRPVVLNFWSESCQPCLSEVPYLRGLYARPDAQSQFTLLGINQGDPQQDIATFGQTYNVNYVLLFDPGSQVNIAYDITSLPQTYFIDSNGIVRYVVPQQLTPQAMQQGLQSIGVNLS
jgi:cytochrome c biogenesis protein CcmG/thiol:disulfide interchange protein DsbE